MRKQRWTKILALGLVLFSFSFVPGCVQEEEQETEKQPGKPVKISPVQSRTLEETVQAIGTLEPTQEVMLRPEIGGRINEINFTEGQQVEAGQLLYRLEAKNLQHRYLAARSSLEGAKASLENARKKFNRIENLFKRGLASRQRRDDAREVLDTARSRVNQLEQELQRNRERYQDARIHAPFTGRIGEVKVDTGNYVEPGQALSVLYQQKKLEVSFTVPEKYIGVVEPGQTVRVRVAAHPRTVFEGRVHFVSPEITKQGRDLLVKAQVENSTHKLKPGGFSQVELVTEVRKNQPTVPPEALVPTRTGYLVFKVVDDQARAQEVEIGLRRTGYVEITSGLVAGEKVVRSGQIQLSDGVDVRIMNAGEQSEQ